MKSPEERLLDEIFPDGDMPENFPETPLDKAGYAEYVVLESLKDMSSALIRMSRLHSLLQVAEKDGKNELPDIILRNECAMVLKHLKDVRHGLYDAYTEILSLVDGCGEAKEATK